MQFLKKFYTSKIVSPHSATCLDMYDWFHVIYDWHKNASIFTFFVKNFEPKLNPFEPIFNLFEPNLDPFQSISRHWTNFKPKLNTFLSIWTLFRVKVKYRPPQPIVDFLCLRFVWSGEVCTILSRKLPISRFSFTFSVWQRSHLEDPIFSPN